MYDANFLQERRADLLKLRSQLSNEIELDRSSLTRSSGEPDTEAAECDSDIMTCALANRSSAELHQVDAALDRLTAGRYGRCSGCDQHILPERLVVRPWADLCIDCQRLEESHHSRW